MKCINLRGKVANGATVLVDDEDFVELSKFKWHLLKVGYAARRELGKKIDPRLYITMHRAILNPEIGKQVDHINGNKLDNRRENLRICSKAENMRNTNKRRNNTSGFKGVVQSRKGRWVAHITKDYKMIHLGTFTNPKEAAVAYDNKARDIFGEFAKLNF